MKLYCIYKLISPSGKCYVGQTKSMANHRFAQHKYRAFHKNSKEYNLPLYKAIRKYGWNNFKKEIVLEKIAENKIDDLERFHIKEYNSLAPNGYNLESGGNKNKHLSEETKRKIGESKINNNYALGKKRSEETKRKISENHYDISGKNHPMYGKHLTEEVKRKISNSHDKKYILCYDLEGNFIKEYKSINQAARELNLNSGNISSNCWGKYNHVKNFNFKFKENND